MLPLFTERTREFCFYAGFAGVLFTLISTVHVFAAAEQFTWGLCILVVPNLSSGIAFLLMIKRNRHVLISLNITLLFFVGYFLLVYYLLKNYVIIYSPSTLLLFVYVLAIVAYGYITDLPGKLKENYLREKEEAEYWKNKI